MNRLPMEQREHTGPAMQGGDEGFEESGLKGDYTCHWRSLSVVLENTGVHREEMCVLAQNTDRAEQVQVDRCLHTKY